MHKVHAVDVQFDVGFGMIMIMIMIMGGSHDHEWIMIMNVACVLVTLGGLSHTPRIHAARSQ